YNDADLPIEYIDGQEKIIAGYRCELAKVPSKNEDNDAMIEVWYAKEIPNIYWADLNFLRALPGAALSIIVKGNGYVAKDIETMQLPISDFEIPEYFKDLTTIENLEEQQPEYYDTNRVAEDRIIYANETEDRYGLKDDEGNIIIEPKFNNIAEFVGEFSV